MLKIIFAALAVLLAGCQSADTSGIGTDAASRQKEAQEMNEKLIQAAEQGRTDEVKQWLAQGADINAQDERGRTPIMAAVHGNRVETVKALVKAGADIDKQDARSDNPLLYASAEGQLEIVRLMIDAGADTKLTNRYGGIGLIPAADRGHVEVVRELLTRSDSDVNHVNRLGWTALLEAVILGDGGPDHTEIVALLIEHGADVNLADRDGVTPLQHAKRRGYTEMAKLLSNAGAK